jgi:cephalosporin hydroxylase
MSAVLPQRPPPVSGRFYRPRNWHRLYLRPRFAATVARHFARLYYARVESTVFGTRFLGVQTLKYPTDLWTYQQIATDTLPDLIVETGTWHGGSALFLATVCDALGHGRVVSIDIDPGEPLPEHPRVTYLKGSSVDTEVIERVHAEADGGATMAILDSAHDRDHVLDELRAYGDIVTPECYLIVEDTNVNGSPVLPDHGPGPGEAVADFLAEDDRYVVDRAREQYGLTASPGGFLRRVR